ncbi:hypothetical protein ACQR16_09410 [Bradyrhizobium oligotrophicum]|uniref:hypothetical protein n=1 Tax=Bradyrhizobium oligotrophicum TaxID=44255 RepID=UPI003EB93F5F
MPNVISFRSTTASRRAAITTVREDAIGAGRRDAARPAAGLPDDIRKTVILLDLALQHARGLSGLVADERAQQIFDRHLASIEYSLQIARERMSAP